MACRSTLSLLPTEPHGLAAFMMRIHMSMAPPHRQPMPACLPPSRACVASSRVGERSGRGKVGPQLLACTCADMPCPWTAAGLGACCACCQPLPAVLIAPISRAHDHCHLRSERVAAVRHGDGEHLREPHMGHAPAHRRRMAALPPDWQLHEAGFESQLVHALWCRCTLAPPAVNERVAEPCWRSFGAAL